MSKEAKEAIETLRWNIEYTEGRFLEDDGTAADDEFRMSLDAMKNALTVLEQQPPAGEFVKECRELNLDEWSDWRKETLCDRLDRTEAINKDLLTACEEFMKLKALKEQMNQIIEQREWGLVGICVKNDDLAKKYQKLYKECQELKPTVGILIEAAIARANKEETTK